MKWSLGSDGEISIFNPQNSQMKFSMAVNDRKILIDTIIDDNTAMECMYYFNKIVENDKKYNTKEPIEVCVSSLGGSAWECFQIVDMIEQLKNDGYEIITTNISKAYSAGMAIALCGSKRRCYKRARYMVHDIATCMDGKLQEILDNIDESKILRQTYYDIITSYTNITNDDLINWHDRKQDKFFSAKEMFELKGVEEII